MCTYFSVFKKYVLLKEITFHKKKKTFYQRITIHKARIEILQNLQIPYHTKATYTFTGYRK